MTQATGMALANGEFVDIAGIDCMIALQMKKVFITLFSCWNKVRGKKVIKLYLVELILFVG